MKSYLLDLAVLYRSVSQSVFFYNREEADLLKVFANDLLAEAMEEADETGMQNRPGRNL